MPDSPRHRQPPQKPPGKVWLGSSKRHDDRAPAPPPQQHAGEAVWECEVSVNHVEIELSTDPQHTPQDGQEQKDAVEPFEQARNVEKGWMVNGQACAHLMTGNPSA